MMPVTTRHYTSEPPFWIVVLLLAILVAVQVANFFKWSPVIDMAAQEEAQEQTLGEDGKELCFWLILPNNLENVRCGVPDASGAVQVSIPDGSGGSVDVDYNTNDDDIRINVAPPGVYPPEEEVSG